MKHYRGRFVVVDGPDGGGKTTQLDAMQSALASAGLEVVRAVEPGGTDTGKQIREILLHRKDLALAPMCETLLFMASRAQLMDETVNPALARGAVVLCDRFISATLAYQGALGVDREMIVSLGETAIGGRWPDLTLVLDVPVEVGMARVGRERDRMESRGDEYHTRVREGFSRLDEVYPAAVVCVDAVGDVAAVTTRILSAMEGAAVDWNAGESC